MKFNINRLFSSSEQNIEDILKYKNRQRLFHFLIESYGFTILDEKYYPKNAGGFYVDLVGKYFLLRYYHDRNFLSIDIANLHQGEFYSLSFIKDLIYNPEVINGAEISKDNASRIKELNDFLIKDFERICELFSDANYPTTKKTLDEGLKKQFYLTHPTSKD